MPTDVAERARKTLNSGAEQRRKYRFVPWIQASGVAYSRQVLSRRSYMALAAPAQSPTGSESGRLIEGYVERFLLRNRELASAPTQPAGVSSSPLARSAIMTPWDAKNWRRIRLIDKKYKQGLDVREAEVLARLKSEVATHIEIIAPRTGDLLDEQAARLERLNQKKSLAKKGKNG